MTALNFSLAEYADRMDRLRQKMDGAALEVLILLSPENVYYFSGYFSLEPASTLAALIVPIEGDPILVARRVDRALTRLTSWVESVQVHADRDGAEVILSAIASQGWSARRIGIEEQSPNCGVRLHRAVSAGMARLVDGSGLAEACRAIKSAAEITCLEAAARRTDAGLAAILERLDDGVSDNDLAAAAYAAMVRAGSEFMPMGPIVAGGPLASVTHANFSRQKLSRGDAVFCHLAAVHHRYCGPGQRLMTIGEPDDDWRSLSEKAYRVQDAVIAAMKPGVSPSTIEAIGREAMEREGVARFGRSGGNSIGVGFHSYAESGVGGLNAAFQTPLAENMCFHPTVGLQPRGGPVICAADLVVIEAGGARILGGQPRGLLWKA